MTWQIDSLLKSPASLSVRCHDPSKIGPHRGGRHRRLNSQLSVTSLHHFATKHCCQIWENSITLIKSSGFFCGGSWQRYAISSFQLAEKYFYNFGMQIKIVSVNLKLLKNLFTWFKLKNISKNALFTLILAQKSIA